MADTPVIIFRVFDATESANPSGFRHINTHPAFIKEVDTSSSGALLFGNVSIGNQSDPKAIVFSLQNVDLGYIIDTFKFWQSSTTAFAATSGIDVAMITSGVWVPNIAISSGDGVVPKSLPGSQNVYRQDDATMISGMSGVFDSETSQYIYLRLCTTSNESAIGNYGTAGGGNWRFRMTYNWTGL